MKCTAKNKAGKPCGAPAVEGKRRCIMHSRKNNAAEFGARGGSRRKVYPVDDFENLQPPKDAADLKAFLGELIARTMAGKTDPKVTNTIAYTGTSFLRACELSDQIGPTHFLERPPRFRTQERLCQRLLVPLNPV